MTKFKIEWLGEIPSITEEEYVIINRELQYISEQLKVASDLFFHTIFLTDDFDKRFIMVDGKDEVEDTLFLTYYEDGEDIYLEDVTNETTERTCTFFRRKCEKN